MSSEAIVMYGVAGLIAASFGVFLFFRYRYLRGVGEVWEAFAGSHGFQYEPGGMLSEFNMMGDARGRFIRVWTEKRSRGRSSTPYTVYEVRMPTEAPGGLVLYDESLFSKVAKMFGGQDIEVGHPGFDERFIVRGDPPSEVYRFLGDDAVIEAFNDLHDFCSDMHLEDGALTIEHQGYANSRAELEGHLEALVECVDEMDAAGASGKGGQPDGEKEEVGEMEGVAW